MAEEQLTDEGEMAIQLALKFAGAGMSPEKIGDTSCQVATQLFQQMRFRGMLVFQGDEK